MSVMDRAVEYASLAERRVIFHAAVPWLLSKGTYRERTDSDCLGMYDGVPVRRSPIAYDVEILGTAVRRFLPQAATQLAIGRSLRIEFQPAYYEDYAEREAFISSYLRLFVERDITQAGPSDCILLDGPDSAQAFSTVRLHSVLSERDSKVELNAITTGLQLNRETGLDNLTVLESIAWLDIVDRFDDLWVASGLKG